jgi:enoyl-CoA hydratase/carnithine racemase
MNTENILVKIDGARADIILNRPDKYNALTVEMCSALADTAEKLAADPAIKCIVFSGAGRNFCAGFDVALDTGADSTKMAWLSSKSVQTAFARLHDLPVVTICQLHGYVVGAGLLLAAVCNLRYATPDTIFYIPELDMGIPFSLGGVATLARYIGTTRTTEMVLTCNKVTASHPHMQELVTQVLPPEEISEFVDTITTELCNRPASLLLASLSTLREAERALLPPPASDLFTMLYVDVEQDAKSVRNAYSQRFSKRAAS